MRFSFLALALLACASARGQLLVEAEPNDVASLAMSLPAGAQVDGAILSQAVPDEDWYQVDLPRASDLRAWTGPGRGGPLAQIGDTYLALRSATGQMIVEVDDGNLATHGYYSVLSMGGLAAGRYYLVVRGRQPSLSGTYSLDVMAAATGTLVRSQPLQTVFEGPEDNDPRSGGIASFSAVYTNNLGSLRSGGGGTSWSTVGGIGDYDYFTFVMPAPGIVTLATLPGSGIASGDTVVHLVNVSGNRLDFDDDSGPGAYSLLHHPVASGTYHAVVSGFGSVNSGSYQLQIQASLPLSLGAASTVVQSGGCQGSAGLTPHLGPRENSIFPGVLPEQPVLGSTYVMDLVDIPPNAAISTATGFTQAVPPVDLSQSGAPGCFVEVSANGGQAHLNTALGNGVFHWAIALPLDVTFLGLNLEMQAVVFDPLANAAGVSLSNRSSAVCGMTH